MCGRPLPLQLGPSLKRPADTTEEAKAGLGDCLKTCPLPLPVHCPKNRKELPSHGRIGLERETAEFPLQRVRRSVDSGVEKAGLEPPVLGLLGSDMRMAVPVADGIAPEADGILSSVPNGRRLLEERVNAGGSLRPSASAAGREVWRGEAGDRSVVCGRRQLS